jgi:hypothetical protein
MSTYNAIAWLPLCAGLTGIGLVASWFAMRKRGLASGLHGAAWSLLPLAAYLTGSIEMFWKIGTAIGGFAASLVFSPKVWSGVGVAALAAVLFVVSGARRRRRKRARGGAGGEAARAAHPGGEAARAAHPGGDVRPARDAQGAPARDARGAGEASAGSGRRAVEAKSAQASAVKGAPADDDMREVEEILRRRGIS